MTEYETGEQRGLADTSAEPRFLLIGQIVKPHGLGGEVRVESITDTPERFNWIDTIWMGDEPQPVGVERVRFHKAQVILKLAGFNDRNSAETLRSVLLHVPIEQAIPLKEGEYFMFQALGLSVSSENGELLGEVVDLIETGANIVFVVEGSRGEILIPDTDEVVKTIDFEKKEMIIVPIPGLFG